METVLIPPETAQGFVDAVLALPGRRSHPPKHFMDDEEPVKKGREFNANRYFSVLDRLSMPPGYVLDYVYFSCSSGGEPIVYARRKDQSPYRTYSEYEAAGGEFALPESQYGFVVNVRVDGSAEGYFQFVVLRVMGSQFYLDWHAAYNDDRIICDRAKLEELHLMDEDVGVQAQDLDFQPSVAFREDCVLVRVVVFTNWGGFLQRSYTIHRDFPHRILEEETETLVPYDCGLHF